MYHPLFSLAAALTVSSIIKTTSAGVAGLINPRYLDERQLCRGDSYNDVFNSVGMGRAGEGAQNDIEEFCHSWIPFRTVTSYYVTITPTTTCFPATVTVNRTTEIVYSPTSTVTVTASQTEFAIERRSHVRKKDAVEGRAVAAAITPRAELPKRMIQYARQVISTAARSLDVEGLRADLSSACSCLFLPAPTTNLPSTAPEVTRTIGATNYATATLNTTVAGGITTITETLNVTSLVRPTGAASQLSGTVPLPSSNSTISGPGNGIDVRPTFNTRSRPTSSYGNGIDVLPTFNTRPRPTGGYGGYDTAYNGTGKNYGTGYSHGTGTGSLPQPTENSVCTTCTAGIRNVTVTVTALATSTVLSTTTDIISDIIFKNTTITVTAAEATVTLPGFTITEDETTVTETGVEEVPTVTEPGVTGTETVTESEETATVTISVATTGARAAVSAYRAGRF
ncbi:hypothetical protein EPUS_01777 [Endocarpon pusillum Z07020]|uniref:Uncharacterized protein n=1 Tax=Endocarpon pusillum (strain Z07020 / HMAS-L-300199) TaxID=1263415 RepID=U1G3I3_ENDPU|nr:uncharacterized protein EPUS_01777 [Endocarpon pusillum Z07020]ERF71862.1 hypothetical protein EPUS_01777 [Endocarpon pusillum Z07020]